MPSEPVPPLIIARSDLVQFLNTVENVTADRVNSHLRAKYASLAETLDTVKPAAAKYNLALRQMINSAEGMLCVETYFLHRNGEQIEAGRLTIKTEGMTPQQLGSALTYLRRQSIHTACGIATDQDDDAHAPSHPTAGQTFNTNTGGRTQIVSTTPTAPRSPNPVRNQL